MSIKSSLINESNVSNSTAGATKAPLPESVRLPAIAGALPALLARRPNLADFNIGPTLGTGSFGRVRFVTQKEKNTVHAVKILKKSVIIKLQQVKHIMDEKAILERLNHTFIVNLLYSFQDPRYLYLVLEYVIGGEFFTHLRRTGRFTNDQTKFYGAQITLVFEYLHKQDIIYRDLKPENLLIDVSGYLKITDFGFAKVVPFKTYTLCGTPEYIAPEVLLNKGHGKGVDWWTLGILIFETLVGQPPFNDDDPMGIYQQILQAKVVFPRIIEKDAKSLIKHLLTHDLTKRYGCLVNQANDIKQHRWFDNFSWEDLVNRKITAPFQPEVRGPTDTHNFERYPDSVEEAKEPVYGSEGDPFLNF